MSGRIRRRGQLVRGRAPVWLLTCAVLAFAATLAWGTAVAAAAVPTNTSLPTISGSLKEGRLLTAKEGKWLGSPESFSYQWQRCREGTCQNIAEAATAKEYEAKAADVRSKLRVQVIARNSSGSSEPAYSGQTEAIAGFAPKAVKEQPPIISGAPHPGQTLRVSNGGWTGTPATEYGYLWESCTKKPKEKVKCGPAEGEHGGSEYQVPLSEEGATLRAVVTDINPVGSASATSAATSAVALGPPVDETLPTISGEVVPDIILTAEPGMWASSSPITFSYQWQRCNEYGCQPIALATSKTHTVSWQDIGTRLAVAVTATDQTGHASSASSSQSSLVPGGTAALGWGNNYPAEQLGSGIQSDFELSPVTVLGIADVKQMAVVTDSSFALLADGTVRSWGGNLADSGVLGDGSFEKTSTKVSTGSPQTVLEETSAHEVRPLEHVTMLAASGEHVMALLENGEVATWGSSNAGQRGNGEKGNCYGTAKCVITNETTGKKEEITFKAAEEKGFIPRDVAYKVPHLSEVVDIAAGGATDYALLKNGTVEAWGANSKGMLGVDWIGSGNKKGPELCGSMPCSATPRPVCAVGAKLNETGPPSGWKCESFLEGVTAIAAGAETGDHYGAGYAISHGKLLAWGNDKYGQLGNGSTETEVTEPAYVKLEKLESEHAIAPGEEAVAVAGGNVFALALLADGQVIGWGSNNAGELGGTSGEPCTTSLKTCQLTPKLVGGLHEVSEIAAGVSISFALSHGTAYGLGYARHGQLGFGTATPENCGEVECQREWTELANLGPGADRPVSQIVADSGPNVGGTHNFAVTASGIPPVPQMSLTAGAGTLQLAWTFGKWYEKKFEKVKWRRVPTAEELLPYEHREAAVQEALETAEASVEEAAENGETEQARKYEEEVAEKKAELKAIEAESNQLFKSQWQLLSGPTQEVICEEAAPCEATISEYLNNGLGSARYEVKVEEKQEIDKKVYGTPGP